MEKEKYLVPKGLIDLHVHAGPSVSKRLVDAWEVWENAKNHGFRAAVIKDHYFPTMMSAEIVNKHITKENNLEDLKIYGEIVLNNAVGGINIKAVDIACEMGAKIVSMPTVSAKHHIQAYAGKAFVGGGKEKIPEKPIYYLDEKGNLLPEVIELIDYLAKAPEVILATGHGSPAEIDELLKVAFERGIKRVLVNHPFCLIDATVEQMKKWASMGAYIELNACDIDPVSNFADGDLEIVREILEEIPASQIVIDSDYGQFGNIDPVEGLIHFTKYLQKHFEINEEQVNQMGVINPGWLLGLNDK